MRRFFGTGWLQILALTTSLLVQTAFAEQTITIADLGTLGGNWSKAFSINNKGQAVGVSETLDGSRHAFIWQNSVMTDLGTLGGRDSEAHGINDKGQVVGFSETTLTGIRHAFIWQNGVMTDLGTLPTGQNSEARGINNLGQVVGFSETTLPGIHHAFIWQDGVMTDLRAFDGRYCEAYDINNLGQVVGAGYTSSGVMHAFMWANGVTTDLGAFDGDYSVAYGINDRGQVVGASTHYQDSVYSPVIPFMWEKGNMTEISNSPMPVEGSLAQSINNRGLVAGFNNQPVWFEAYILHGGVISLLPDPGQSQAFRINESCQVAGYVNATLDATQDRAVIWSIK